MAKYKNLEKIGELKVGMELYRKTPIDGMDGPYVVNNLYLREGSGIKAVTSVPLGTPLGPGSRMTRRGNGDLVIVPLDLSIPKDWYIRLEENA